MRFEDAGGWPGVLGSLVAGHALSAPEAQCTLSEILEGRASEAQIAAFAVAFRAKGETVEEVHGLVMAMLAHAEPVSVSPEAIDVVGTGGDRLGSINVSTLAALIAAGAGVPVCKHGNRAASSSVGTADVLEALGVVADLGAAGVARCVEEAGMGFCFAQRFHAGYRHVGPVRRQLGVPTIFNVLGPLSNPARVTRQLVGVSEPAMAIKMAGVLGANGSTRAIVVYADDGLDELSVTSPSTLIQLVGDGQDYQLETHRLDARDLGIPRATMTDLSGGDAAHNARAIRSVLEGKPGAHRDIGVLNAAAALLVAGRAGSLGDGVELAQHSLDTGAAAGVLARLVEVSGREAAASA